MFCVLSAPLESTKRKQTTPPSTRNEFSMPQEVYVQTIRSDETSNKRELFIWSIQFVWHARSFMRLNTPYRSQDSFVVYMCEMRAKKKKNAIALSRSVCLIETTFSSSTYLFFVFNNTCIATPNEMRRKKNSRTKQSRYNRKRKPRASRNTNPTTNKGIEILNCRNHA